jgi:hypothetical protein
VRKGRFAKKCRRAIDFVIACSALPWLRWGRRALSLQRAENISIQLRGGRIWVK